MGSIRFEWDELKNKSNVSKHGISFHEAQTVFYDPRARIIDDPDHSELEDRFIIMGISRKLHLLVVCHCYRSKDGIVRIISARKATSNESRDYEGGRNNESRV